MDAFSDDETLRTLRKFGDTLGGRGRALGSMFHSAGLPVLWYFMSHSSLVTRNHFFIYALPSPRAPRASKHIASGDIAGQTQHVSKYTWK
jgi:hypothetical protein